MLCGLKKEKNKNNLHIVVVFNFEVYFILMGDQKLYLDWKKDDLKMCSFLLLLVLIAESSCIISLIQKEDIQI
jgi:hypothetical protein